MKTLILNNCGPGSESTYKERQRQIEKEGWSIKHDDEHESGELTRAALCYEQESHQRELHGVDIDLKTAVPDNWPWNDEWWKPSPDNRKKELIKAGALYRAEIERLYRRLENIHIKIEMLLPNTK